MERLDFDQGWRLEQAGSFLDGFGPSRETPAFRVPHDAMIATFRTPNSPNGPDCAWYTGGTYQYLKDFFVPEDWADKAVCLEFEGVSQNCAVYVNSQFAGKCPNAYTTFQLHVHTLLRFGETNQVKVVARSGMQHTSRWYTGAGLYRPVWLLVGENVHVAPDGIRVETKYCGESSATLRIQVPVESDSSHRVGRTLELTVSAPDGSVAARDRQPVTLFGTERVTVTSQMDIAAPALWSVDHPALHDLSVTLLDGERVVERQQLSFGIRSLQVTRAGLKLNGASVKLRGACVHHDNGILGAISLKDAEVRKVKRLKAAGFNAIRSAHNPASRYLLEACDEVGMLVMDELFDVWNESKRDHDYSLFFDEWWRFDMERMVEKDFNHPSVILYSLGNEIPETGSFKGAAQNRAMTDFLRKLDPTRPVTNCINGMFSVMPRMREIVADVVGNAAQVPSDINALMTMFDDNVNEAMQHEIITQAIEETCAGMDVCGYNYMNSRYASDGQRYPNRIIVGSETYPDKIGSNWPLIMSLDHVLGDFCWTGWDYIGEAGVGKNDYELTYSMYGPWPWYLAYCGDHDLCGNRRPQSYYREIVFGLRTEPYLCVERPEHYNQPKYTTSWTWSDVVESWTWPGFEGSPIHVEVYSDGDEVELLLNGTPLARQPVEEDMHFKALFDTIYTPGRLIAVSYKNGRETGRMTLTTAGAATRVALTPERDHAPADGDSLIYVGLSLVDKDGVLAPFQDMEVTVAVEGPAALIGFGSADPRALTPFDQLTQRTFDGKALLVLRSTRQPDKITVTASAPGLETAHVTVITEQNETPP